MRKFFIYAILAAPAIFTASANGALLGLTLNGNPPGTLNVTGDDVTGAQMTIVDTLENLSVTLSRNRFITDHNDTYSYTGGSWDFQFSMFFQSGLFISPDQISIQGTAQHVKPVPGHTGEAPTGDQFTYNNLFIQAVGNVGMLVSASQSDNKLHRPLPGHMDLYTAADSGTIQSPVIGQRELNPWLFTLNGTHVVPEPASLVLFANGILVLLCCGWWWKRAA